MGECKRPNQPGPLVGPMHWGKPPPIDRKSNIGIRLGVSVSVQLPPPVDRTTSRWSSTPLMARYPAGHPPDFAGYGACSGVEQGSEVVRPNPLLERPRPAVPRA